ncbi:MAG: hypothetical protein PHI26_04235, partial [Atopobiaceae bacterium]|nr:hypothetical protein [Atopobiaceae bacterium]
MKRLWNMSQTTKVILCSIFVLVLVIEPNLSLAAPWFTSQKAYGETTVAAQEAAATEEQAATPEATVAEEPVAAEEPAVEEQEPVAVEEGPSAKAPAAEESATEEQTADEAVEPTPAESPVAVEATTPSAETATTADTTKAAETKTEDGFSTMATQNVMVQYDNNPITAAGGTFTLGTSGVAMTATIDGVAYTGSDNSFPAEVGKTVVLTFSGIPTGKAVNIQSSTGNKTISETDSDKTFSFTMDASVGRIDLTVEDASSPTTCIVYQNNPVTPTNGTFTLGTSGVSCTVKVGANSYTGSSSDIPAAIGDNVAVTFSGIPSGSTVVAEVATSTGSAQKTISSTDTDKTFSFAMSANSGQVSVTVNSAASFVLDSQYTSTYKTTYASIQYRVGGGAWTDLATGTTEAQAGQGQDGNMRYSYTLPSGTADIRVIQPTNGTGKLTTNGGVGWMGMFMLPTGTGHFAQPYPNEFDPTTGYEIDGYGVGSYTIGFTPA